MEKNNIKVIISGGGSGGHIFPAIAIANALQSIVNSQQKTLDILFVGVKGRIEMEKVPAAGYKIEGLWISGFQRRLTFRNLLFPVKLLCSMSKARSIINKFNPDLVIGVGGYASGPMLKAATKKGIPTLIQEQNSYPGITNKILSKKVDKICVAYDNLEKFFPKDKIIMTGNPIRRDIAEVGNRKLEAGNSASSLQPPASKREKGLKHFGLSGEKKTILAIGGSQGAKTINESIDKSITMLYENGLQLIWQTGKNYYMTAKESVKDFEEKGIKAYEFINEMEYAYSVADIIVSRAGAIAISELCVVGKPVILIPSPNVAEDHQTKNAMAVVNKNGALIVKDADAKEKLGKSIIDLFNNKELQEELANSISKLAITDSAERIAEEALKLVKSL